MARFASLALLIPLIISSAFAQVVCLAVVSATVPFQQALSAHATGAACPTAYYQLDNNSSFCCAITAQPRTLSGSVGCCACGVFCTGNIVAAATWGNHAIGPETITTTQITTGSSVISTVTQTFSSSPISSTTAVPSVSTSNLLGSSTTQTMVTTTGPSVVGPTTRTATGTTSSAPVQSSNAANPGVSTHNSIFSNWSQMCFGALLGVFAPILGI